MDHRIPMLGLLLASSLLAAAQGKVTPTKATPRGAEGRPKHSVAPKKLLELNLATKAELMKLPGINEAQATKIIAGRPYLTKTNLVTRNILPVHLYKPIRHLVTARQAPAVK